jgi:hypothetical protein
VRPDEHAIAYSSGHKPHLLEGEKPLRKAAICIEDADGIPPLDRASRIYFGIHHPIQKNVKVKDLGRVKPSHVARLRGYWTAVISNITNQAVEVTARGVPEDDSDEDEEEEEEEEEEDDDDDEDDEETDEEEGPVVM